MDILNGNVIGRSAMLQENSTGLWPTVLKFLTVALYSLLTLGIVANISVFATVARVLVSLKNNLPSKQMLVYVLALSTVDCFVLLNLPFIISDIVHETWIFGELLCKLHYIGDNLNKTVSTLILTTLSFDRYLSVCHPYSFLRWRSVKITVAILCANVLFGLCLLSPLFVSTGLNVLTFQDQITVKKCSYIETDYNVEHWFFYVLFTFGYLIPLILMVFFHGAILTKLYCNGKRLGPRVYTNIRRRNTVHTITKRMVIVIVFYFTCWTPYWGANLSIHLAQESFNVSISEGTERILIVNNSSTIFEDLSGAGSSGFAHWGPVVYLVLYLLVYANSAVNPFLYGVFNLELKRQTQNMSSLRRPPAPHQRNVTESDSRSFWHLRSFFGKSSIIGRSPISDKKSKYQAFLANFEPRESCVLSSSHSHNDHQMSTNVTMVLLSRTATHSPDKVLTSEERLYTNGHSFL